MTLPPPQQAPHILMPASQKADASYHLPPAQDSNGLPSLAETEPPLCRQPHTYLPAHFSIAPPSMPRGLGEGTGSKHTTQASGLEWARSVGTEAWWLPLQAPESQGLVGMAPQKDISQ